ncbi:Crp/Fnr family transcriptional regulator [uncultured Microscilla sp.]|uniref:Crp/Fnr family transcriptional regulator n=1 Tax=uncultured Microscilla sp. TaxID=432653 RepID=UPI002636CA74|nr:Crp/Fnr family transcriptional regulator [uncultured Microscilla sp.]
MALTQDFSLYNYLITSAKYDIDDKVKLKEFEKGEYVYLPNSPQNYIYLIESGVVKIGSYANNGEKVIYDILTPGETFGNLNYLGEDVPFFEFAQAISGAKTSVFELKFFKHLIVHDPTVSEWFNITVVGRWSKAETRLLYMTRGNIEARIENLQKELSHEVADKRGIAYNVFNLLSQQDIADLTGTTRQTVAKKLRSQNSSV